MMSPAGFEHGRVVIAITVPLANYLRANPMGVLTGAETGFHIGRNPDTVRAPDVAYISADRVPKTPMKGFFQGAPDLAVEVLSPEDRAAEVLAKAQDWLAAGCRGVWVIDPRTRTVMVYRSRSEVVILGASETLTGEDPLPGFSVPVAEIFAG
jgi:Uma2 family endonuclease